MAPISKKTTKSGSSDGSNSDSAIHDWETTTESNGVAEQLMILDAEQLPKVWDSIDPAASRVFLPLQSDGSTAQLPGGSYWKVDWPLVGVYAAYSIGFGVMLRSTFKVCMHHHGFEFDESTGHWYLNAIGAVKPTTPPMPYGVRLPRNQVAVRPTPICKTPKRKTGLPSSQGMTENGE